MVAALAVGGVLLAMMIAASGYAAIILPADARVPLHLGSHQHVVLMPAVMIVVLGFQVGALVLGAGEEPRSVRAKGS